MKFSSVILCVLGLLFGGCAHPRTSSWPARSLESFGTFDSATRFGDVLARVGKPDLGMNISGILTVSYHLVDDSWLQIRFDGSSEASRVLEVWRGKTTLYSRFEELRSQPLNKTLQPTPRIAPVSINALDAAWLSSGR